VFDEAHELEEVMTASLGVEVAPGRFRALATMSRPLLGAREDRTASTTSPATAEQISTAPSRIGSAPGCSSTPPEARDDDRSGGRLAGEGDIEPDGRTPSAPAGGPGPERPSAATRRSTRPRCGPRTTPARPPRAGREPTGRRGRPTAARWRAAVAPGRGPRRCGAAGPGAQRGGTSDRRHRPLRGWPDEEVAWVDGRGGPRCCASPPSSRTALAGLLWDEVTAVLTSATIPQRLSRARSASTDPPSMSSTSGARSTTGPTPFCTWPVTFPTADAPES